MFKYTFVYLISILALGSSAGFIIQDNFNETYQNERAAIIQSEDLLTTGGQLHLDSRELKVDEIFLRYKHEDLVRGFREPDQNAAAMHFFKAKPLIERSKVFNILQQMPKGALLHVHTASSVSSKWIVMNVFYTAGLLKCTNKDNVTVLTFRKVPEMHKCATPYVLISEERQNATSAEKYDEELEKLINLYTPTPELEYSTINVVWSKFQYLFNTLGDVLQYIPIFRSYHWQMLQELYDDNVMYVEVRTNFYELYDLSGQSFPPDLAITELIDVTEKFKQLHPDFLGLKMIYSTKRNTEPEVMHQHFEIFKKYHKAFPDYIIGFDMVGQEDKGKPIKNFVNIIRDLPKTAKYFFHAGETNWYGSSIDYNLLDAILMNTTRIGHGYALMKHPILWNDVKTRDIAIEVSPISNQVLKLVEDLRNHPGAILMSQNIPMVICNDDPGFWNAKGLNYDFYYAIMSFAPNYAGLKTLKQLVWNSIKYSVLQPQEREKAYVILQSKWEHFLDYVLEGSLV